MENEDNKQLNDAEKHDDGALAESSINEDEGAKKSTNSTVKEILDWLFHIVAAVVVAILIVKYVAQVTVVVGTSMFPTLENGNRLMMDKISTHFREPQKGDIVVVEAKAEVGEQSPLIKRIIALEGDRVEIIEGIVHINGEPKEEGYINGGITEGDMEEVMVPPGYIFVMGDNRKRNGSIDSRILGPFPEERIIGRVLFRIFPINQIGTLKYE